MNIKDKESRINKIKWVLKNVGIKIIQYLNGILKLISSCILNDDIWPKVYLVKKLTSLNYI